MCKHTTQTPLRDFLEQAFWEEMKSSFGKGSIMPEKMLKEQLGLLTYMAKFDGKEETVALRVGRTSPRVLYIDLCDDQRRVVS